MGVVPASVVGVVGVSAGVAPDEGDVEEGVGESLVETSLGLGHHGAEAVGEDNEVVERATVEGAGVLGTESVAILVLDVGKTRGLGSTPLLVRDATVNLVFKPGSSTGRDRGLGKVEVTMPGCGALRCALS